MSKRAAIAGGYGLAALAGVYVMSPWATPSINAFDWILMALGLFCIFAWLGTDRREHGHVRSPWMNIGIVLLAVVFVPVYLARTRPSGRKLRAVGGFGVVLLGWVLAYAAGGLLGFMAFPQNLAS